MLIMTIIKINDIEKIVSPTGNSFNPSLSSTLAITSFLQTLETTLASYIQTNSKSAPIKKIDHEEALDAIRSIFIRDGLDPNSIVERIQDLRNEIIETREAWRSFIKETIESGFYTIYQDLLSTLDQLTLVEGGFGAGACYYLVDKRGEPQFVIKPVDEDIFCMNNRKGYMSFFLPGEEGSSLRATPRYESHKIDMMASDLAIILGIKDVTPEAVMWIHKDLKGSFFDITDSIISGEEVLGKREVEKLCSVQRYIPQARELFTVQHELFQQGYRGEEFAQFFDQEDLELASLFMMVSGDSDGHGGNLLAYIKRFDDQGRPIYGIKKVDNGLSFPTENGYAMNSLLFYPNAEVPFSPSARQKALAINEDLIASRMAELGFGADATHAMRERVKSIKSSVLEGCSIREVGKRIRNL